jgi:AcrR family transcriptional regulator
MYSVHKYAILGRMSMPSDLRSRKRIITRQGISDAATRLFLERGFDQVTIDEIAAAAGVGRMTVFNYFPRKEDMFFDRDEEGREILCDAVRLRGPGIAPLEALRLLTHELVIEGNPYAEFSTANQRYIETVEASETLKARARAIRDETTQVVTEALAESVGRDPADPDARLAASLLLATWTTALMQAHRHFQARRDSAEARATFLALADQGTTGIKAALAGTPYV